MPSSSSSSGVSSNQHGYLLVGLLIGAVILRLILVSQGGQYFFGDEMRHDRSVALYDAVRAGDFAKIKITLSKPDHFGFTILGAGITALQHFSAQFTRWHDWRQSENEIFTMGLGAAWLAMFSVLNIWLVYRIARQTGAGSAEAGWAALLMACSNTGFYFSRHFLPYDAALSCALAAIWAGLSPRRPFLCGVLAGATYDCYNGYWYLVPVILVFSLFGNAAGTRERATRFGIAAFGAVLVLAIPIALGLAIDGRTYWHSVVGFGGTVNQGLFREGWSLPWEYFWHSEGGLGCAVILLIGFAIVVARRSALPADRRIWFWLAAVGMCYGWLVLFSVGLEKFVVYARSVKPFVPFFCLAGGWAAARLLRQRPKLNPLAIAACCIAASINFIPHFYFAFPREVELKVLRDFGNPKHSLSVAGSLYWPLEMPLIRPDLALVNAQLLYPVRSYLGYPDGTVIFSVPHPLSYPPFQYESHNPRERALLRENEISIRLIKLARPSIVPADLPPQARFTAADRPDGHH